MGEGYHRQTMEMSRYQAAWRWVTTPPRETRHATALAGVPACSYAHIHVEQTPRKKKIRQQELLYTSYITSQGEKEPLPVRDNKF